MNRILDEMPLVAAVVGKAAKQMKNSSGEAILMLNVFAQTAKLHLAGWSVHGDKKCLADPLQRQSGFDSKRKTTRRICQASMWRENSK